MFKGISLVVENITWGNKIAKIEMLNMILIEAGIVLAPKNGAISIIGTILAIVKRNIERSVIGEMFFNEDSKS